MGNRKLNKGKTTTIDLVSPTSDFSRDNISKHRSCWKHVLACQNDHKKRVTKQECEEIKKRFERTSPCFWQTLPHRERSKRTITFNNASRKIRGLPLYILIAYGFPCTWKHLPEQRFVADIYKAEGRSEKKQLISRIPLLVPKVPQQCNEEECGNFVLYFINLFMEGAPENFTISEGYPYFMKQNWFTPQGLECFIEKLESLKK